MAVNKLKEMIDKVAADALLSPQACVVTYSRIGGLELWFTKRPLETRNPAVIAAVMMSDLYKSPSNGWCSRQGATLHLITRDAKLDREVAMVYDDFIQFVKERETPIDKSVEMMIQNIKGLPTPEPIDPKCVIHTQYYIDHQTFETMDAAVAHQKTLQIFDEFSKVDLQGYDVFEDVIKDMVDDPEKYIKILQVK